jgi:hypothetical protein
MKTKTSILAVTKAFFILLVRHSKFRQHRYDKNGEYLSSNKNIETTINIKIINKADGLFVTEHKYTLISWLLMYKKIPSMFRFVRYYCA